MNIVVASTNPVKLESVVRGFAPLYGTVHAVGLSVPSGVSDQPVGIEETLTGALNRAWQAHYAVPQAPFAVGIEGGVERHNGQMYAMAWVAVVSEDGRVGTACSGQFLVPLEVAQLIDQGMEMGDADDQVFGRSNSKQQNGAIGLLTGDAITRADYYAPAVTMALIPFRNPNLTFSYVNPSQPDEPV